jgi:hypothetical protein
LPSRGVSQLHEEDDIFQQQSVSDRVFGKRLVVMIRTFVPAADG